MEKTDEEINIAIAEVCGWEHCKVDPRIAGIIHVSPPSDLVGVQTVFNPGCDGSEDWHYWVVPDYCNDLNAMHEAEKTLRREQYEYYLDNLCITLGGELYTSARETHADVLFLLANKTAKQKAEAFLRTLGKW